MIEYKVQSYINCIDSYVEVDPTQWASCPKCGFAPRVWVFDNGRSTACGCWNTCYGHFSIHAESINSVHKRTGNTKDHDSDALRSYWNHWCTEGVVMFEHASNRKDGRW